jgi:aminopeptidase N
LSGYGGFRGDYSSSDVFRAHEVAHQWWGDLVDVRDWPRDRWIMESFAEYVAMEYYRIRFDDVARYRRTIQQNWFLPETAREDEHYKRLDGGKHFVPGYALWPLSFGKANVYTKGPLVLHMLRYLFRAKRNSDAGFWELMRQVQTEFRDRRISTEQFIALAEKALGEPVPWFWTQWLHRTEVPTLDVTHTVAEKDGAFVVTVQAKQQTTDFTLAVPVYLHFDGGRHATVPLWIDAKGGKAEVKVRERPGKVTFNDFYEALVVIR